MPDHWHSFGARISPLTGSPRLAANPPNAILNYLYALLESEARLAAAALGLDPGLGVPHVDTPNRDSLACDLMEPVRPQVDAYHVDDVDATIPRAVAAGAKLVQPIKDQFYGDRSGTLHGPFGHVWTVATHKKDVSSEEMMELAGGGVQS